MSNKFTYFIKFLILITFSSSTPIMQFETLIESSTEIPLKIYPINLTNNSVLNATLTYYHPYQNLSIGLYEQTNLNATQKYKQIEQNTFENPHTLKLFHTSQTSQILYILIYPTTTPIKQESITFTLTYTIDNSSEFYEAEFPYKFLTFTPRFHVTTLMITCVPPPNMKVSLQIIFQNQSFITVREFSASTEQHLQGIYDEFEYKLEGDETVGIGIEYSNGWLEKVEDNRYGIYLKIDEAYYLASHKIHEWVSYFVLSLITFALLGCGFYFSKKIYMKSHTISPSNFSSESPILPPASSNINVQIEEIITKIKNKEKEYNQFNQEIEYEKESEQKVEKQTTRSHNYDIQ